MLRIHIEHMLEPRYWCKYRLLVRPHFQIAQWLREYNVVVLVLVARALLCLLAKLAGAT